MSSSAVQLRFAVEFATFLVAIAGAALVALRPSLLGASPRTRLMLPVGFAFVAALPQYRRIGLHIIFIGCFAAMVFAVSVHVILSHGGATDLLERSPWQLKLLAALLLVALAFRMLVDLDADHLRVWLGSAAATFLASTLVWAQFSIRHLSAAK